MSKLERSLKVNALRVGEHFIIPVAEQTCSLGTLRGSMNRYQNFLDRRFHVKQLENGDFRVLRMPGTFHKRQVLKGREL